MVPSEAHLKANPIGAYTRKGQKLYLLVFDWPERSGILPLNITNNIKSAKLLATDEDVTFERINNNKIEFSFPEVPAAWEPNVHAIMKTPNKYVSVVVVEVEMEGKIQP